MGRKELTVGDLCSKGAGALVGDAVVTVGSTGQDCAVPVPDFTSPS